MAESHGDLDGVETSSVLREPGNLTQMHEKLTSSDESHDKENLLVSLEDVAHANQEWMVSLEQDIFLQSSRLHLVILNDHVFSERLHGINIVRSPLLNEENFSEGAAAND